MVQAIQIHFECICHLARPRGRPQIHIDEDQLIMLLDLHFSVREITSLLQVSPDTVRRIIHQYGLQGTTSYSLLTDLDAITREYVEMHPHSGSRSYVGYLRSQGLRVQ